jgi:hydroxymethylbilane synthase
VPERAPANDVLVARDCQPLCDLPQGACVGTSSPRRSAQMLRARPDLRIEPIRGNVDTRIAKVQDGAYDATLLALAGLVRLGLAERATEILPFDTMLPAPGQGALALEARADDARMLDLLGAVHDAPTAVAVSCERAVLSELGGGCSLPLGALAETADGSVRVRAILLSPDGATVCIAEAAGSDPAEPARAVAGELRRQGADRILEGL